MSVFGNKNCGLLFPLAYVDENLPLGELSELYDFCKDSEAIPITSIQKNDPCSLSNHSSDTNRTALPKIKQATEKRIKKTPRRSYTKINEIKQRRRWEKEDLEFIKTHLDAEKIGTDRTYLRKVWEEYKDRFQGWSFKDFGNVCRRTAHPGLKHRHLTQEEKDQVFEVYQKIMSNSPKRGIYAQISRELGVQDNLVRYVVEERLKKN